MCQAFRVVAIFASMKAKTTRRTPRRSRISAVVSTTLKRRLRKVSKQQDLTMTAVLENLLDDHLPETDTLKVGPGMGKAWVKANYGLLKGKFTKADFERDDLLGYLLRKHAK